MKTARNSFRLLSQGYCERITLKSLKDDSALSALLLIYERFAENLQIYQDMYISM